MSQLDYGTYSKSKQRFVIKKRLFSHLFFRSRHIEFILGQKPILAMDSEKAHSKMVKYSFQDELLYDSIIFCKVRNARENLEVLGVHGLSKLRFRETMMWSKKKRFIRRACLTRNVFNLRRVYEKKIQKKSKALCYHSQPRTIFRLLQWICTLLSLFSQVVILSSLTTSFFPHDVYSSF